MLQNWPASEDFVDVSSSVVPGIEMMLMIGIGCWNGISLPIVHHSICVPKRAKGNFPIFPHSGAVWVVYPMLVWYFMNTPLHSFGATHKYSKWFVCTEWIIRILSLSCTDPRLGWFWHHIQSFTQYSTPQPNRHYCWQYSWMHLVAGVGSTRINSPENAGFILCFWCHLPMW